MLFSHQVKLNQYKPHLDLIWCNFCIQVALKPTFKLVWRQNALLIFPRNWVKPSLGVPGVDTGKFLFASCTFTEVIMKPSIGLSWNITISPFVPLSIFLRCQMAEGTCALFRGHHKDLTKLGCSCSNGLLPIPYFTYPFLLAFATWAVK